MMHQQGWRTPRRFVAAALLGVLVAGLALVPPARAAGDLDSVNGSLKSIPADAAFYTTLLRNREQIDIVAQSRAWAKLKSLPAVQMGLQMLKEQLKQAKEGPFTDFLQLYQLPENQQLIELLGDMFSDEVFCYGGESCVGFTDLTMQMLGALRYGPALMQLSGENPRGGPPNRAQVLPMLRVMAANLELIKPPDLLIGFKLRKAEPAEAQLKRLETLLEKLAEQAPPLKGRIKRAKLAGGDFLTLTLDGSLLPWDRIPIKQYQEKPGEFDELIKKLKELKLTISLGIRDNYVMLVLGEANEALTKLGGDKRLADRPELKQLAAHADKRLTSISYVSQALRAKVGTTKKDIDGLVELANQFLPRANLTDEQQERARKDLAELAKDVKTFIPEAGASLSFSFLTDRGTESYAYDWSESKHLDGSKPLPLLEHVGGSPLLAVVGRSKYSPQNYQMLVKWLKVANRYFEEIGVPKLDADKREQYEQIAKIAHPLLKRLDEVTGQMLLPALADSQAAFVLDGKLESKQWHPLLPVTDKPMPMLEPALVLGVSDAALLRKACGEYRAIVNDLMAKLHELKPQDVPDFQIPEPQTKQLTAKAATSYFYPLPEQLSLDPQIVPNAGLSDKVAVLTISHAHSERLLAGTPLKSDRGPLADTKKPLAFAVHCDWAAMVTTLSPWVELGVRTFLQSREAAARDAKPNGAADSTEDILKQVRAGLEILKVLRSYSSSTYFEGKVLVTHSETVFKDL